MTMRNYLYALSLAVAAAVTVGAQSNTFKADAPKKCSECATWNRPLEPFRIYGNTYYVGVDGLSALLITGDQGLVLLDGGLPQSAPLIDANIRALGFRTEDVRVIVNSHAHYDHAGGIAALQRASGARVAASASSAKAFAAGEPTPDDPQYGFGRDENAFPPVKNVQVVADGQTLTVGNIAITAHLTPGHTPGSTAWAWRACEGATCLNVVYADSLTAVSAPGFRFTGGNGTASLVDTFRASIAKIAALPCDIMVSTHPSFSQLQEKLARRKTMPAADPMIDPQSCRTYAAEATKRLDARIADERKPQP